MSAEPKPGFRVERTTAFVDAVLAILLTLLVLGIEVPEGHDFSQAAIVEFLSKIWRDLHPYVGSFVILASYWIQHTVISRPLTTGTRTYQWLNVVFLLPLSLVPFITKLRATYPSEPVVELLFGGTVAACSLLLYALWRYEIGRELVPRALDRRVVQGLSRRILGGSLIAVIASSTAIWYPALGTLLFMMMPALSVRHRLVDSHL